MIADRTNIVASVRAKFGLVECHGKLSAVAERERVSFGEDIEDLDHQLP